jgi:transcriptional regulator with XRE-family HTH domain
MDLVKVFGWNVREAREARGLTQEDLEGMTGLRRSYISDLERGTRNPSIRALQRIATALGVPPSELLRLPSGTPWPPPEPKHPS